MALNRSENVIVVGGDRAHIEGSMEQACGDCGRVVWISPSGMRHVNEGAKVICVQCFCARDIPLEAVAPPSDEVLDEVEKALGFRPTKAHLLLVIRRFLSKGGKKGAS